MKRPTTQISANEESALAATQEAVGADGQVLKSFLALPFGDPFFGRDGRGPYVMRDAAQAEAVLAATKNFLGSCDMMVDYDHQSELAAVAGVGGQAKAAGWVTGLRVETDGIHVDVDWTPAAEAALAAREYRYVSPNFRVSKETRDVTRMVNIGLTNSPNLELQALAHQEHGSTGADQPMKMISIAALAAALPCLALTATSTETEAMAAIDKLKLDIDGSEAALASLRTALSLGNDAGTEVVLAAVATAVASGEPDPTRYVPKAGFDELSGRLKKIEDERILASVDAAVADGRVPPAMKDWAINLGRKDEAELHAYLGKAVAFAGGAQVGGEPKREPGKLSGEEKAICSMLGVAEDDFLKNREEEAA